MLSYRQFLEEQKRKGNFSSLVALAALLVHGGKQAYKEVTDPGHGLNLQKHWNGIYNPSLETHLSPEELANYLQNLHPHEVVVYPKVKKPKKEENENTKIPTRRP